MNTVAHTLEHNPFHSVSLRSLAAALFTTSDGTVQVLARLALGAVMFPHGAQKMARLQAGGERLPHRPG